MYESCRFNTLESKTQHHERHTDQESRSVLHKIRLLEEEQTVKNTHDKKRGLVYLCSSFRNFDSNVLELVSDNMMLVVFEAYD